MSSSILHVVNIYFVIPYFLGDQLSYFYQKGYQEHIICSPSPFLKEYASQQHFLYKEIPVLRKISLWQDLKTIFSIYQYIRQNRINIVVGHTPKGALLAMIAAFCCRTSQRIYFRHGLVYETSKGMKKFILKAMEKLTSSLATQIVCVSPSIAGKSIQDRLNSPHKQIILSKGTCNGIDTSRFCKNVIPAEDINNLKKQYHIQAEDIVIGFTGRLVKDKGIIELTEAFTQIRTHHPQVTLLLVGILEERDGLPDYIIQIIKNNPHIVYTGFIENNLIHTYYALMDIFVLPSYREGFPTSVLEASAMNLPIITTKATGCVDAIQENRTGLFVNHNVSELTQAILKLIDDEKLRYRLGKTGREFVKKNFRQEIIWEKIEKLYKQ